MNRPPTSPLGVGLTEIDGVAWCVTHDAPWHEGDTRCNDRPDTFGECVEVPLYRGYARD